MVVCGKVAYSIVFSMSFVGLNHVASEDGTHGAKDSCDDESGTNRNTDVAPKSVRTLQFLTYPSGKCPSEDVTAVWVDTFSPNLLIQSCTASFTSISGPIENGQGEFIKERHRARFVGWIRGTARNDHDGGSPLAHPHDAVSQSWRTC